MSTTTAPVETAPAITSSDADSVTVPYTPENIAALAAVALYASKDAVTPIITAARISAREAVATDRYSVGRLIFDESADDELFQLIPATALQWLGKQTPRKLGNTHDAAIVATATALSVVSSWGETLATVVYPAVHRGNYPPVARLFDTKPTETGEGVGLVGHTPASLERIVKTGKLIGSKGGSIRLQETAHDRSHRAGPVLVTFEGEPRFTTLAQPVLTLR